MCAPITELLHTGIIWCLTTKLESLINNKNINKPQRLTVTQEIMYMYFDDFRNCIKKTSTPISSKNQKARPKQKRILISVWPTILSNFNSINTRRTGTINLQYLAATLHAEIMEEDYFKRTLNALSCIG